jgi:hypothetical protein
VSFIKKAIKKISGTGIDLWNHLHYRILYKKPTIDKSFVRLRYLSGGGEDFLDISKAYCRLFPNMSNRKINEANLICDHIFDLLGSGPKRLSKKGQGYQLIDWHCDFKSDYHWKPRTFFKNIRYGHKEGIDIKVPWELSRFQHLNILGQAFVLTKDKKYAEEFKNQIMDWIQNNPAGFGVNWRCTMDVAIRATSWLVAQEYFSDEEALTHRFWRELYTSIYEHGKFIRANLEDRSKLTNNHYVADLVGLLFIAVYCPFFKESMTWQRFAIRELTKEIEKQVYPDGSNFEASTSYHRLALELFFYAELIAQRAGLKFSSEYKNKVKKMFEFSLYCIKPNGKIPQIGDNDNGRFLVFSKKPILEHKYLLSTAVVYYNDSKFKIPAFEFDEETFWIFGYSGSKIYDMIPPRKENLRSMEFLNSGFYILRDKMSYCFVTCGPNGQKGNGGHAHNDKLSFELMLNGRDIIVDPGTYVYTAYPRDRNKFRSTEYHNTIKFEGYEQNEIPERYLFNLPEELKITEADMIQRDSQIVFQGQIYFRKIRQKRTIVFESKVNAIKIEDSFSSPQPLKGRLLFHLPPDLISIGTGIFLKDTKAKIASININNLDFDKGEYDYSPEYGKKVKAECLIFSFSQKNNSARVCTFIGI